MKNRSFCHKVTAFSASRAFSDCNDISQVFYDELISSFELISLVCPCCHHGACMSVHGYYNRQVRDTIGDKHPLRMMRTKCSCCHHTSAILPSVLVLYSQIPLEDQNTVIDLLQKNASATEIADAVPSLDENNVKSIILRYVKHWLQQLLAESIPRHPLEELTRSCFQHYSRQSPLLQNHPFFDSVTAFPQAGQFPMAFPAGRISTSHLS